MGSREETESMAISSTQESSERGAETLPQLTLPTLFQDSMTLTKGPTGTRPVSTGSMESLGVDNAFPSWFDNLWNIYLQSLGKQTEEKGANDLLPASYGVCLTFPPLLRLFATLLRSREQAPVNPADTTTQAASSAITIPIRRSIFAGSKISSTRLLDLVEKWETRLEKVTGYKYAARLVLSPDQAHSYSLSAFHILNKSKLEAYILTEEEKSKSGAVKESKEQANWIKTSYERDGDLELTVPPKLYACRKNSAFPLDRMSEHRGVVVSLASLIKLPLLPTSLAPSPPQEFVLFNGSRPHKIRQCPFLSLRGNFSGLELEDVKGWVMWDVSVSENTLDSPLSLYLINYSGEPSYDAYHNLLGQLKFELVQRAVEILSQEGPFRLKTAEICLPRMRFWPEQPLDLALVLREKMAALFSDEADLGELSPGGSLHGWLTLDVLSWPKPHQSQGHLDPLKTAVNVRSTPFLLVWDKDAHLPLAIARLAPDISAPFDTDTDIDSELAHPSTQPSTPESQLHGHAESKSGRCAKAKSKSSRCSIS